MITTRLASPGDAEGIVNSVRSGFDEKLLNTFIYGASGIVHYVREHVSVMRHGGDTVYWVASDGDAVAGALELRLFPNELFVNYVAVLPEYRSLGIGKQLFKAAVGSLQSDNRRTINLDVFLTNSRARNWYEKIGFQPIYNAGWWSIETMDAESNPDVVMVGWPQARACFDRFGFGQFRLTTLSGSYEVGLMCDNWFRVTKADMLADLSAMTSLGRLDPSRRILAIISDKQMPRHPAMSTTELIARSARLSAEINAVSVRLS